MPYTQADADAVREAILKLSIGRREVSVSFAGPPARSITYQMVQLSELKELLAEINRSIGSGPSFRLGATNKGRGGSDGGFGSGGF